ncbi:MAG: hypothetical protein J6E46_03350 [Faecalicoccus sp.]|nr:hypothetical protein [Faecalicoccus sp.]
MELTYEFLSEVQKALYDEVKDYIYRDEEGLHISEDAPAFTKEKIDAMLALSPLIDAKKMFG